ncbi:hypothetical protein BGX23_010104 [Mortierella sp. AD031]|nr:hypothetical protein BGX23_010104 [Mortierella sp. AD031]
MTLARDLLSRQKLKDIRNRSRGLRWRIVDSAETLLTHLRPSSSTRRLHARDACEYPHGIQTIYDLAFRVQAYQGGTSLAGFQERLGELAIERSEDSDVMIVPKETCTIFGGPEPGNGIVILYSDGVPEMRSKGFKPMLVETTTER